MKHSIKIYLKAFIADSYLLTLSIIASVMVLFGVIQSFFSIHQNYSRIVTHYSAYSTTHFYHDQWTYLYVFPIFMVLVLLAHLFLAIKLQKMKRRTLAIMIVWFAIGLIAVAWIFKEHIIAVV